MYGERRELRTRQPPQCACLSFCTTVRVYVCGRVWGVDEPPLAAAAYWIAGPDATQKWAAVLNRQLDPGCNFLAR